MIWLMYTPLGIRLKISQDDFYWKRGKIKCFLLTDYVKYKDSSYLSMMQFYVKLLCIILDSTK